MTARAGMSTIITQWRNLVNDSGTVAWTDDEAQVLLDRYRSQLRFTPLREFPQSVSGTVTYLDYEVPKTDLESFPAFELVDRNGNTIGTADYTLNEQTGAVRFDNNQFGSARFANGYSYDLNAAAAAGWREAAGAKVNYFNFSADGSSFNRSEWFTHCLEMEKFYNRSRKPRTITMVRSDTDWFYADGF